MLNSTFNPRLNIFNWKLNLNSKLYCSTNIEIIYINYSNILITVVITLAIKIIILNKETLIVNWKFNSDLEYSQCWISLIKNQILIRHFTVVIILRNIVTPLITKITILNGGESSIKDLRLKISKFSKISTSIFNWESKVNSEFHRIWIFSMEN